jgi:hypothetical protein
LELPSVYSLELFVGAVKSFEEAISHIFVASTLSPVESSFLSKN